MTPVKREDIGPTWADVYDYQNRLEILWGCGITFQTRLSYAGRPERLSGMVTAQARHHTEPLGQPFALGYHPFRGNAGAATMPGAMWHALSELEGRLAGVQKVAQARLPL